MPAPIPSPSVTEKNPPQDPVAAGAWEGVRNGTVAPPLCPQPDAPSDWMQEDCLYLSVFTPQVSRLGRRSARGGGAAGEQPVGL